jgi:hypothetical protein
MCALCFQGRGYSPAFIANFQSVMALLNADDGDHTKINIVAHTDSVCEPCPNRMGKACASEEKIAVLDNAHATALEINHCDSITWGEAKKRIAEKISLETFHQICSTCHWKQYGICEDVIHHHSVSKE